MPNEGPRQLADLTAAWQQAQEAFEESERRYRDLVDHSLGLFCTHDLHDLTILRRPHFAGCAVKSSHTVAVRQ